MARLGIGKRTLKRRAMNNRLAKMFIEKGYQQTCELKEDGCLRAFSLSWAHSKKSRYIVTDDDWMEAALACPHCHDKIEAMSHEEMFEKVMSAIGRRG
jgi:hypothetical protein